MTFNNDVWHNLFIVKRFYSAWITKSAAQIDLNSRNDLFQSFVTMPSEYWWFVTHKSHFLNHSFDCLRDCNVTMGIVARIQELLVDAHQSVLAVANSLARHTELPRSNQIHRRVCKYALLVYSKTVEQMSGARLIRWLHSTCVGGRTDGFVCTHWSMRAATDLGD